MAGFGFLKTIALGLITMEVRCMAAMRPVSVSLKGHHRACVEAGDMDATVTKLDKCKSCQADITPDQRLGGYNLEGHGFVLLTDQEVKAQLATNDSVLTVRAIVPISSIPKERLDKAYYIAPSAPPKFDKRTNKTLFTPAHRGFEMLRAGLMNAERAAVVTYAERGHEKLAVIYPLEMGCMLYECFFDNEIPNIEDLYKDGTFDAPILTAKESSMGALLLQNLFVDEVDWSQFEDGYVARVHAAAVAKANGEEIAIPDPEPELEATTDLEAALEAQLAAFAGSGKPAAAMPAAPPTTKKRKSA